MRNKILLGVVGFVILALTFLGGMAAGSAQAGGLEMRFLRTEVQGNLNFYVNALCMLRTGDTEGAIRLLEPLVDNAITTLPRREAWDELTDGVQRALVFGKVYKTAFPPESPSDELVAVLEMVPEPSGDRGYRRPATREVLRMSREAAAE